MNGNTVLFNFMMKSLQEEHICFALFITFACLVLKLFNSHQTVHVYLVLRLGMRGAVPSFPVCLSDVLLN